MGQWETYASLRTRSRARNLVRSFTGRKVSACDPFVALERGLPRWARSAEFSRKTRANGRAAEPCRPGIDEPKKEPAARAHWSATGGPPKSRTLDLRFKSDVRPAFRPTSHMRPRGLFFWKALLLIRISQNGRRPAPMGLTETGPITQISDVRVDSQESQWTALCSHWQKATLNGV